MKLSKNEIRKLLVFILENKDLILSYNNLFDNNTLTTLNGIINDKIPNNFILTQQQVDLIIEAFIKGNNVFNINTPSFIIENIECIKIALQRDINCIDLIENIDSNLEQYIVEEALRQKFILKENSSSFFKRNFFIALNSIRLFPLSADFIDWDYMKPQEVEILINEIIKSTYTLSPNSHVFLTENKEIALASIKKDRSTIEYVSEKTKNDPIFFQYVILNDYPCSYNEIIEKKLSCFSDLEVLVASLKRLEFFSCFSSLEVLASNLKRVEFYRDADEKYVTAIIRIFNDTINSQPSIKSFYSIFETVAEAQWKEHRKNRHEYYDNIFGKICAELRNANSFEEAINNLIFLDNMQKELDNRYVILHQAMLEYFNIFHSKSKKKLDKLEASKEIIAKLSALYISISKEDYKKEKLEQLSEFLYDYFTLNLDNPYIRQKLIQAQKREKFKSLYNNNNEAVCNFINEITLKYQSNASKLEIQLMISAFINHHQTKLKEIIPPPHNYEEYQKYKEAIKLIYRLNRGYIKYTDIEVFNFKDIISYDENKKAYVYTGITFDDSSKQIYDTYDKTIKVFEMIKKDIMMYVNSMELDEKIDDRLITELAEKLPFTDEYFKFNSNYFLNLFSLRDLIDSSGCCYFNEEVFASDYLSESIYNLLVKNGLVWILLFLRQRSKPDLQIIGINTYKIVGIINNIEAISILAKEINCDISDFSELLLLNYLSEYADNKAFAILGKEIIEKLCKSKSFIDKEDEDIILMAEELICQMAKRSNSTVPYVCGSTINYNYSLYDPLDESLLISGIDTDSCFKLGGIDNDFLHYCALNKNGFIIKITDSFGNFIARASGFRYGNCVFINQLRTIYDRGGNYYDSSSSPERNDIIETFRKACIDIVTTSQENPLEIDKIDFVFVTRSYCMSLQKSNISGRVEDEISYIPMDNQSDDWRDFIQSTVNLQYAKRTNFFTTDYGDYPIICMAASSKAKPRCIKPEDLKRKDVPALYERKRNKIIVTTTIDQNIYRKINKIKAIKAYLEETAFTSITIPEESILFIGDNWYIIYNNGEIIDSCLLEFDSKASIEFVATQNVIQQYICNNQQQLTTEQAVEFFIAQNPPAYTKVLRNN